MNLAQNANHSGLVDDVFTNVRVDGNNVIIGAYSIQGKALACNVGDNAKCERMITNGPGTFVSLKAINRVPRGAVLLYKERSFQ